jgi:hypothetical protein
VAVRRRVRRNVEHVEFPIPLDTLLTLLDAEEVAEGDDWTVTARGRGGITLRRERVTRERFDASGEPVTEDAEPGGGRGGDRDRG